MEIPLDPPTSPNLDFCSGMIDLQNEMFVTPGIICATVSAIYFTDTAVVCPSCMSQTDHQIITPSRLISVALRIYNSPLIFC